MKITEFDSRYKEILIDLIRDNDWPFHAGSKPTVEKIEKRIEQGFYSSDETKTFLISKEENQTIGFLRLTDLDGEDPYASTPLFDIRICEHERNNGFGKKVVNWINEYIFSNYPNTNRIEATTRHDNIAMRKVLEKCGYVKEGHYRKSWPAQDGKILDTIGYGILRDDWNLGTVTQVDWDS